MDKVQETVERAYAMETVEETFKIEETLKALDEMLSNRVSDDSKKFRKLIKKSIKKVKQLQKIREKMWTILNWHGVFKQED